MDGKIENCVYIKFCVKLGKSATEILEMLHVAFGEYPLSRIAVFGWHSRFKSGQLKMTNVQGDQAPAKRQKMLKKFENSSTITVAEQSISSQTPLGSVMESAMSTYQKI
jgi:hypothetical protein